MGRNVKWQDCRACGSVFSVGKNEKSLIFQIRGWWWEEKGVIVRQGREELENGIAMSKN